MTDEFQRALERVLHDVKINDGEGAELVATGVKRDDCLALLHDMLEGEAEITPELLAIIVQFAVATGVWLERARWT